MHTTKGISPPKEKRLIQPQQPANNFPTHTTMMHFLIILVTTSYAYSLPISTKNDRGMERALKAQRYLHSIIQQGYNITPVEEEAIREEKLEKLQKALLGSISPPTVKPDPVLIDELRKLYDPTAKIQSMYMPYKKKYTVADSYPSGDVFKFTFNNHFFRHQYISNASIWFLQNDAKTDSDSNINTWSIAEVFGQNHLVVGKKDIDQSYKGWVRIDITSLICLWRSEFDNGQAQIRLVHIYCSSCKPGETTVRENHKNNVHPFIQVVYVSDTESDASASCLHLP